MKIEHDMADTSTKTLHPEHYVLKKDIVVIIDRNGINKNFAEEQGYIKDGVYWYKSNLLQPFTLKAPEITSLEEMQTSKAWIEFMKLKKEWQKKFEEIRVIDLPVTIPVNTELKHIHYWCDKTGVKFGNYQIYIPTKDLLDSI